MVGNMIRVLRARMALLAVDEAGMSTVEYGGVLDCLRLQQVTSRKTDRSLIEHQSAAGGYCPYTPRSSPCMTQRCC